MIYNEASRYLRDGPGTLRNRIYNEKNGSKAKQLYALVSETLRYRTCLQSVVQASGILREKRLNLELAMLMVHDLLLTRSGRLACGKCPEKDAIIRHKTRLHGEFVKYKIKHRELADVDDSTPVRWLRINASKVNDISALESELFRDWECQPDFNNLRGRQYFKDKFVPGLYGVAPETKVAKIPAYEDGRIIIQDRASCLPVTILRPRSDCDYIDACAAPGNKTTQLAANSRHVWAFELDPKRAETLRKMVGRAGLEKKVTTEVADFTTTDPSTYPTVKGIVVDPSCSGSGIFGRSGLGKSEEEMPPERLANLAEFQYAIMLHALQFQSAETVVYSTCSIHSAENEEVVRRLLETEEVANQWSLRLDSLPGWPRRGLEEPFSGLDKAKEISRACIRVEPKADGGIGFFAACFDRKKNLEVS